MNPITPPGPVNVEHSPYARLKPLSLGSVNFGEGFWKNVQVGNHKSSLNHAYDMLEKAGNFHNFRLAAGMTTGEYRGRNFLDSDVFKWLEAVAWELGKEPDEALQIKADTAISLVQAAQCYDGYLNCYVQTVEPASRWADMDHGHELYCAGFLFQAGIALFRALGDRRLLDVSTRYADLICNTFGKGKLEETCGHPEVEMALIELFRTTGEKRYLQTAQFFIDQRGKNKMAGFGSYGPEYHQDHIPVRKAVAAEGHAVRQLYLTAGVTDLFLETGEPVLWETMQRQWKNMAGTKLYITGGIGSRFDGEAFGDSYELPPDQCYCETCASVANVQWNWRMLLVSGDSRYADMIERSLYNTILASPALDGRHYFYVNPLQVRSGKYTRISSNPPEGETLNGRPEWHGVACCPPNVMRTIASLEHYMATQTNDGIQIHQYAPMDIDVTTQAGKKIVLSMETKYPLEGKVSLLVKEADGFFGSISLRYPQWCPTTTVTVNGEEFKGLVTQNGYCILERGWKAGDRLEMDMEMEPVLIEANPRVDAVRGCVAIQYGPIVYCLESYDQQMPDGLQDVQIDIKKPIQPKWRGNLLGGTLTLEADGYVLKTDSWKDALYLPQSQLPRTVLQKVKLVAIPYYKWGNRGIGSMRVWIPKAD
jgi:DUF1680 family protein